MHTIIFKMLTRHQYFLKKVFKRLECQYKIGFQQVEVLNEKYLDLVCRYKKAVAQGNMTAAYNLYLRVQVVEEVRIAYYDYTKQKAAVLTRMRDEIYDDCYDVIEDEIADDSMISSRE